MTAETFTAMPFPMLRGSATALRVAFALALATLPASAARAQIPGLPQGQLPNAQQYPPEVIRQMLMDRPDLAEQLRRRIGASGLSRDQVRARLRASGYPEDLLDPYLVPGTDSLAARGDTTSTSVLDAMRALGTLSASEADSIRAQNDIRAELIDSIEAESAEREGRAAGALPIFGLSTFRRRGSTQFNPALGGPVDPSYVLGPGDVMTLILTGDVEAIHNLTVTREGFVVIPQVGQVFVANQTLAQVENTLYQRLARTYSGVRRGANATTRFQLSMNRLRAVQVYVTGDVRRPGSFQVSAAGTVLAALYAAGGPTDNGSLRAVEVRRGSKLLGTVDLYDYLLRGINRSDLALATGDVIFVPPHGARVKVTGEVMRPAIYEALATETLRDVIQASGGFRPSALTSRVQIHRILPAADRGPVSGRARVVVDVTAESMQRGEVPPYPVEAGDSVVVFPIAGPARQAVTVQGGVWTPGRIGFTPGMKLGDALRLAGGTKPDVYLGSVLVSRVRPDSTRYQLRTALADSTGRPVDDMVLQEDDEVTVFARSDFRNERYVVVTGAVRKPGRLPFRDGMTIRDAVLEASGLREDAYLAEAEVARLPEDRTKNTVATTVRVPLDSTYLVERGPDGEYLGPPGLPAAASGAQEFTLEPYDNVLILTQPQWELQRIVTLTGQVQFPGRYALTSRTERLTEVISRAGGLTSEAYPTGIELYRTQRNQGRIGVDLPRALENPRHYDNLILVGGDSIHIPEYNPVVQVRGAVNAPVAVTWVKGKDIDFYVAAAGGYRENADKGRAYVTQPSGKLESVKRRFLLADGKPEPLAGGVVQVPEKTPKVPGPGILAVVGTLATVMAALASVLIAVQQ